MGALQRNLVVLVTFYFVLVLMVMYLFFGQVPARLHDISTAIHHKPLRNDQQHTFPIERVWEKGDMRVFSLTEAKILKVNQLADEADQLTRSHSSADSMRVPDVQKLCSRYLMKPLPRTATKPRLFWGSLFNDEHEVLLWSLFEMIDYLHSFTLVEANITFSGGGRNMTFPNKHRRFIENAYADKLVYIPWTDYGNVTYYAVNGRHINYEREEAIRNTIGKVWLQLGMRSTDIGIVSDADEFVNREYLQMLTLCDTFADSGETKEILKKQSLERKNVLEGGTIVSKEQTERWHKEYMLSRCSSKRKLIGRINQFSSYVDCPMVNLYGSVGPNGEQLSWTQNPLNKNRTIPPRIKVYWHPDAISGDCIIDPVANYTTEKLRTLGGSSRMVKFPVGWHFRNLTSPADALHKYRTYGHPNESMDMQYVMDMIELECEHRVHLLNKSSLAIKDLPLYLQNQSNSRTLDKYFYNRTEFYDLLQRHS